MKKNKFLISSILSILSIALPTLSASCAKAQQKQKHGINEKIENTLKQCQVFVDDNIKKEKLASDIKYSQIKNNIFSIDKNIIIQYKNILADDIKGLLIIEIYIKQIDKNNNNLINLKTKKMVISGFKTIYEYMNEQLKQIKASYDNLNLSSTMPDDLDLNLIKFKNYNASLFDINATFKPNNEEGLIEISLELIYKQNTNIKSKNITIFPIKGFKTTRDSFKEKNEETFKKLAYLELIKTIDKSNVLPSSIKEEDIQLPSSANQYSKIKINSLKPNDEDGTLLVNFYLLSKQYNDSTKSKEIVIRDFLTKNEQLNNLKNNIRERLNKHNLKFEIEYMDIDKESVLPEKISKDKIKFINTNLKLDQEIKIIDIDPDNERGTLSINYKIVDKSNISILGEIESRILSYTDKGFLTKKQKVINTEIQRLNKYGQESLDFIVVNDNFVKNEHFANELTKDKLGNLKYLTSVLSGEDDKINTIFSIEKYDNNLGEINISYIIESKIIQNVYSKKFTKNIKGFKTIEQDRINKLNPNFSIKKIDSSIYNSKTFYKFIGSNKNIKTFVPIEITNEELSKIISYENIEDAKITNLRVKIYLDSNEANNPNEIKCYLKLQYKIQSTINESSITKERNTIFDISSSIVPKFIQKYLDSVNITIKESKKGQMFKVAPSGVKQEQLNEWIVVNVPEEFNNWYDFKLDKKFQDLSIFETNDNTGTITISYKIGRFDKKITINGFKNPKSEAEYKLKIVKEIQRLDSILKNFDLEKQEDYLLKNTGFDINNFKIDNIKYNLTNNQQCKVEYVDNTLQIDAVNGIVTFKIKLMSTNPLFDEISSSIEKNVIVKNLISSSERELINKIKTKTILDLENYTKGESNKLASKNFEETLKLIPEDKRDKFKKIIELELRTELIKIMNQWNDDVIQKFYAAYGITEDTLKIYEYLENIYMSLYTEVMHMFGLGITGPKITGLLADWKDYPKRMLKAETLKNTFNKYFKTIQNNKNYFVNSINTLLRNIEEDKLNAVQNKQNLIEELIKACSNNFDEIINFHLNTVSWPLLIDGRESDINANKSLKVFHKNYSWGRTWLATGGWEQIFQNDRHKNQLNENLNLIFEKYNLDDSIKTYLRNKTLFAMNPIYKMIDIHTSNIKTNMFKIIIKYIHKSYE
ncbi:lipoprotein 17-related variable surface protein [Mycoplasma sp. Mirounga ES2805-ORL]|uniref:lipoprotein 17-related variable surface protein n=1 Tax=Mycoplasma sp. Mirounga ES2805-ORL TaxID=754514 RepID=UPI00197C568E|nr:lipoprotein 17-related variable surface protein [Mycoplasma sp. Mirounga ES2805-ORL]QSF13560.1 hypothetical protein JXZ90_02720 [Mycoplasma sp. Mirounga ES2805-ORL]